MDLDRSPEQLIRVGIAALKQKDYRRAIATFQQLNQADVAVSYRVKAQMGLIRTYEAQGDHALARGLCDPLLKSRSSTIRQWAYEKLQQLDRSTAPLLDSPAPIPDGSDPLTLSDTASTPSGFIPLSAEGSGEITRASISISVDKDILPCADSSSTSLFHYQTLNNNRGTRTSSPLPDMPTTSTAESSVPLDELPPPSSIEPESSEPPSIQPDLPLAMSALPQASAEKNVATTATLTIAGPDTWPKGGRLKTLKSLGKISLGRLWFAQWATIPILFVIVRWLLQTGSTTVGNYLQFIDQLLPIFNIRPAGFFWASHTWTVVMGLGLLTFASPWLWPLLMQPTQTLSSQQLQIHSPEAVQLLRRLCNKKRWPFPQVQLIPSQLPLIFSYGWHPRYGRLMVSQGLLDCLAADELAALMVYEMSHWPQIDWIFFSMHGLLLQGCHRLYWFLARRGEGQSPLIEIAAGIGANLSYIIFWVLAKTGCSLARVRTPYRDRRTAELTGNPNGLSRALGKLAATMAAAVVRQGYTPPLMESLDLMLPVGPDSDLSPGSSLQHLAWGALNPLRHWLSINQGHPPLGDRLYTLSAYARHWRLKPSLNFASLQLRNRPRSLAQRDWLNLLLQGGVWSGLVLGVGAAVIMWLIGAIAANFDYPLLAWLYKDRSILFGIPLIVAATNQLLSINPFFPDIVDPYAAEVQLLAWQTDATLIPLSSLPVNIRGNLTGRPVLANWLGQEWRLHTPHGSIKLNYINQLGPFSNLRGLASLLNQPLEVTGWFRRGHHPWIDIDRVLTHQNQIYLAQYPIWAVVSGFIPLSYGLWILFRGG